MNRLRLFASLIFIFVMSMMWLSLKEKPQDTATKEQSSEAKPDYVAYDLNRIVFDKNGQRIQTLSAKTMTYYESQNRAEFDSPLLLLESRNNKGKWRVSAQKGQLIENNRLLLSDEVNAVNLTESDYIDRITSQYFHIDLKASTMHTEQPVQLFGDGLEITGSGLFADLNQEKIDLIKHANTKYLPKKP